MEKRIVFDMDGTIADLYGVNGWLDDLRAERVRPYADAKPLLNMQALARTLHGAQKRGYKVAVVSWLSKTGSETYNEAVTEAKLEWLAKHLASVQWDEIHIVKYGTPKSQFGSGVLFDDEMHNREEWGEGAHDVGNIIEVIKGLR